MQPIPAQSQSMMPQQPPARVATMEDFMRHKPAKFNDNATPDDTDAWLKECEKIFWVIDWTEAQKLTYATFLLVDDTEYWWVEMQQQKLTYVYRNCFAFWSNFNKNNNLKQLHIIKTSSSK